MKLILENKKLFGIIVAILTVLTVLFNLVILVEPYLISYYKTSNGIVEYFSSSDPEFIIKPYLNGNDEPALVTVFLNLPNNIVPLEENFTSSLIIPFSKLKPYMEHWLPWAKEENTSLLVITTYFSGTKVYSSAEEVEYSPSWVINDEKIQIVAEVNVIGKTVPINWSLVKYVVQKLKTIRYNFVKTPAGRPSFHVFTINVTIENYSLQILHKGCYLYYPTFDYVVIHNISIPLSWVTISNGVLSYDTFNNIEVSDTLIGKFEFPAISNSSNYSGPYIGPSFSANVKWNNATVPSNSTLQSLNSPSLYVYYNATLAIAAYTVYLTSISRSPSYIPVTNVTIFEVLWANPNEAGYAVESYSDYTQINVNGLHAGYIPGNGTPSLIIDFLTNNFAINGFTIPSKISVSQLGYASWSNGYVNRTTGGILNGGQGWAFQMLKDVYETSDPLGEVTTIVDIGFAIGEFLIDTLPENLALGLILLAADAIFAVVKYFTVSSVQVIENFVEYSSISMFIGYNESGHVYASYLNFSFPIPIRGFILNYSNWYYLDK